MRMRKDNRGLSLVELVIVIAILAVVGSLVTMGLSAATSKPAEECAKKIAATLNSARMSTMGKQSVSINLYQNGDYVYAEEMVNGIVTKNYQVGGKGVQVEYMLEGGGYQALGDESSKLSLSFKRTTGGFHYPIIGDPAVDTPESKYCVEIRVTKGTRVNTLDLAYLTGKITVNLN